MIFKTIEEEVLRAIVLNCVVVVTHYATNFIIYQLHAVIEKSIRPGAVWEKTVLKFLKKISTTECTIFKAASFGVLMEDL